ncbi:MAG: DUF565 domain-containing protein [Prochloraceae cyanobacterium]
MQQTRLNTLINSVGDRLVQLFSNPWRRISLILIGFLFGIFVGSAVVTTAGQEAILDVPAAALILLFTEIVSALFYRRNRRRERGDKIKQSLWWDALNVFKIGLAYSLYLEAFKLGS